MGLFSSEDVAAADVDPFNFEEGRHVGEIVKSEESVAKTADGEVPTWVVGVYSEEQDKTMQTTFWFSEDATEEQRAMTNRNIKQMLLALEIPQSRFDDISDNPQKLIGYKVIVEVVKSKKGRLFMNFKGLAKGDSPKFTGTRMSDEDIVAGNKFAAAPSGASPFGV